MVGMLSLHQAAQDGQIVQDSSLVKTSSRIYRPFSILSFGGQKERRRKPNPSFSLFFAFRSSCRCSYSSLPKKRPSRSTQNNRTIVWEWVPRSAAAADHSPASAYPAIPTTKRAMRRSDRARRLKCRTADHPPRAYRGRPIRRGPRVGRHPPPKTTPAPPTASSSRSGACY